LLDARPAIHRVCDRTGSTHAILWRKPRPKIAIERPVLKRTVTGRISKSCRVVLHITVEICARLETNRGFADEPPDGLVVISSAVVIQSGFRI
jgi:hypothetical protein